MTISDPVLIGEHQAPSRLLFGPHETNLGRQRSISDRHAAYYARRAAGGAGIIVTEEASVHSSDWPYERCPLAPECGTGWQQVVDAVNATSAGTLVIAALGHSGGQGSSAYSQSPLLAPSRVPEVNSREVPKWMEEDDINAVLDGFRQGAQLAIASGVHGVEINAGQYSLIRQYISGLTNFRDDQWGTDKLLFARQAIAAAREGTVAGAAQLGRPIVGLRLSCDELAPWAGVTPEAAIPIAVELAELVDYLVVVRGSIFTTAATRPDFHEQEGFNRALCASIRSALREASIQIPVVLQGSIVDPAMATDAIVRGDCDVVEMTRAQIADPALGKKFRTDHGDQVRPCVLCNQMCQVRDARNPIVSCTLEPSSGHEIDDPSPVADFPSAPKAANRAAVTIIGAGPAGLEAARIAALMGYPARIIDEGTSLSARRLRFPVAASGNPLFERFGAWQESECQRLGVVIEHGHRVEPDDVDALRQSGQAVIVATGGSNGIPGYSITKAAQKRLLSAADLAAQWVNQHEPLLPGESEPSDKETTVVVFDPIGAQIGVALAESLAQRPTATVHLVTQDHLAANELARTGDLAAANGRLQRAGVIIERRSLLRSIGTPDKSGRVRVTLADRFTGTERIIRAHWVIDAGFRLPDTTQWPQDVVRIGDAVAPRTIHEAVLDARRAIAALTGGNRT